MYEKFQHALRVVVMLCVIGVGLTSCVFSHKLNYLQESKKLPEYSDSLKFEDYKLQRGDYVYVRVSAVDADMAEMFNGTTSGYNNGLYGSYLTSENATSRLYMYSVDEDGCIDYPYVGKVAVLDSTLRAVKTVLHDKLSTMLTGYSVEVRLANRSFSVIGEAGNGKYQIPREKLTIFEALAMSGDLKTYSNRSKIQIIRQTSKGTVVKTFDIRSRSIVDSEFYYIQPNDVIYVPFDDAKTMGASHVTSVISLTMSTLSFGLFVYSLIDSIIKVAQQNK